MSADQGAEELDGHFRVLMRTERVLDLHERADHLSGLLSVQREQELQRVAHPLGPYPKLVKSIRGSSSTGLAKCPPQIATRPADEARGGETDRRSGNRRAAVASLLQ